MFEKIKQLIEQAKKQAGLTVDPEIFNHPVAQQTEWHPLKGGGANFQTHRLDASNPDYLVFRCTKGGYLFAGLFTLIGALGLLIPLGAFINGGMQDWGLLGFALFFGGIFLTAGLVMLYFMTMPRVFDTFYGYYYKARKKPQAELGHDRTDKGITKLSEVQAIQVLRERISNKNGSYYSYEINLVLKDASRINVIDHGKHQAVIEDAETLATALGVPLWDGS